MAVEHGLAALARTMAATPRTPIPTFEWATVVAGTGEVHVVLDSDPTGTPRPVSDNAAGPVAVGQRVHVAHHGLTLTLLSAPTVSSDVDWTPLTLDAGFTGLAWWCIRGGVAWLQGRVTRDAGNWPTVPLRFADLPAAIQPSRPAENPYADYLAAGRGQSVSIYGEDLRGLGSDTSPELHLSGVSWPVAP